MTLKARIEAKDFQARAPYRLPPMTCTTSGIFNSDKRRYGELLSTTISRELSGKLFHFSGTLIMALEKDMPTQLKYISYSTQFSKPPAYPYPF